MPCVTSLGLSRELGRLYPETKTELKWCMLRDKAYLSNDEEIKNEGDIPICPAFQIHELLELINEEVVMSKSKEGKIYNCYLNKTGFMVKSDVVAKSLVECLGKLSKWVKENEHN